MAARNSTDTPTLPAVQRAVLGDTPAGKAERIRTEVMRLENLVYLLEAAMTSDSYDVIENECAASTLCDVRVRLGDVSEELETLAGDLRDQSVPAN